MKTLLFASLLCAASTLSWAQVAVQVPRVSNVNAARVDFMNETAKTSRSLYGISTFKSAIAPFGGTKITPLLELDLDQLVIVTDSYPGTPDDIRNQFTSGAQNLQHVLELALSKGAMSTSEVLNANAGAQILGRLKLEMGVTDVTVRYWTNSSDILSAGIAAFRDRPFQGSDTPVVTTFDFAYGQKKMQVVLISGYILGDSHGANAGLPTITRYFLPRGGFTWAYLSADGLGFFSENLHNGFETANQDIMVGLASNGSILLDYPTAPTYHSSQVVDGVHFMEGRRDLKDERDIKWIKSIRVERPGIFGYCLRTGDEVRVYQKIYSERVLTPTNMVPLREVGMPVSFKLN